MSYRVLEVSKIETSKVPPIGTIKVIVYHPDTPDHIFVAEDVGLWKNDEGSQIKSVVSQMAKVLTDYFEDKKLQLRDPVEHARRIDEFVAGIFPKEEKATQRLIAPEFHFNKITPSASND